MSPNSSAAALGLSLMGPLFVHKMGMTRHASQVAMQGMGEHVGPLADVGPQGGINLPEPQFSHLKTG